MEANLTLSIDLDFDLLRRQKQLLVEIVSGAADDEVCGALNGIIGMIDAIQDYAADVFDSGLVFGLAEWCIVNDDGIIDRYFTHVEALDAITPELIESGHKIRWVKDPGTL